MMEGIVVVRTGGEIGIKSRPVRSGYERIVLRSVKARLRTNSIPFSRIWRIAGRIYVESREAERAALSLSRLFGVSSTSPGVQTDSRLENILDLGARLGGASLKPGTFAVKCHRIGVHPYSSQDVCRALGEAVLALGIPLRVDLGNPQQLLNVEIRDDLAILYINQFRGPDGFPLGAQEPALAIVDHTPASIIAAWCIMKRGSDIKALSPAPGCSLKLDGAVERNLRLLASWRPRGALRATVVRLERSLPKGQKEATLLSVASELGQRRGVEAIVSGLSPSLASLRMLAALPVYPLFPLIAMDKALAKTWAGMIGLEARAPLSKASVISDPSKVGPMEDLLASVRDITVKA